MGYVRSESGGVGTSLSVQDVHGAVGMGREWRRLQVSKGVKRFFAGAASSAVSRSLLAPLERVKVELQINQARGARRVFTRILKNEGLKGYWKGNGLNLLRTAPFRAINYCTYDLCGDLFRRANKRKRLKTIPAGRDTTESGRKGKIILRDHLPRERAMGHVDDMVFWQRMVSGTVAGVTATLSCFPLDVLRTRMMMRGGSKRYRGLVRGFSEILRHGGKKALYVGIAPALLSMGPSSAVFYGVYGTLTHQYFIRQEKEQGENLVEGNASQEKSNRLHLFPELELGVWRSLIYGAISGAAAEMSVYPLEMARRQLQVNASGSYHVHRMMQSLVVEHGSKVASSGASVKMGDILRIIIVRDGIGGLYRGVIPSAMQVLPSAALSYFTYNICKAWIGVD